MPYNNDDKVFEVTLSLNTGQYAVNDVLADTQEIADALATPSYTAILNSLVILDKDDKAGDFDLVFLRSNTSIGTENSALNISDANAEEIIAIVPIVEADYQDCINSQIAVLGVSDTGMGAILYNSTQNAFSLYIAAVSRDAETYTAAGIVVKVGLLRT